MEETPAVVEDLALGAFRLVKQALDLELDFTAETLPILDHYLSTLRDAAGAPDEKLVSVAGPCAGAYFGEVARRTLPDLAWVLPEEPHDYPAWRLEGTRAPLSFNPIGAALEAIFGEPLADWNAHVELPPAERARVDAALKAVAPVRESDFFRLTVRHEALQEILVALGRPTVH
ncbi:MAG: hypothetical protein KC619_07070 [Myxococcales bacterium]|nr:hypothetical protein [Myxococcales bacterium]